MNRRDSDGIRPSVLLIAAFLAGSAAFSLYLAFDHTVPSERDEVAHADRAGARAAGAQETSRAGHRERVHATTTQASGSYAHHDWSQQSDLTRSMALGLPTPGFWRNQAERGAPNVEDDPQLFAMWRSYHGMLPSEGEGDAPPLPFEPTARHAQLVEAEGDVSASPTSCNVRVLPVTAGQFNCVVRVVCDGEVLYPNPSQSAGYVPCEVENGVPIRAVDDGQTSVDGDPLVSLDLEAGTVTVEELDENGASRYRATLRFDG